MDRKPMSDCTRLERHLMERVAKGVFNGNTIVDAGAGRGGSAYHFAKALREQGWCADGQIHSFDWFDLSSHASLEEFLLNTAEFSTYITINNGDITKSAWSQRAIDVLFLDIEKSLKIHVACARLFLRGLRPGSMILQQDFGRPHLPWVHYTAGALLPFCRVFDVVDDSIAMLVLQDLPDEIIRSVEQDRFSLVERHRLIDAATEAVAGKKATLGLAYESIMQLSHAYVEREWGNPDRAMEMIADVKTAEAAPFLERFAHLIEPEATKPLAER